MSTRKVLVDLSKKISRASVSKVRPRTSVRSLFTSEKLEFKDKNVNSVPEKFTTNTEQWNNNQTRSDLPLHGATNTSHQQANKLDLHAEVIKNMENGRFSLKSITAIPETWAKTSIAGSDVLINWFEDCRLGWSYTKPVKVGCELYNTRTGIRQKIEGQANVITPSYIVSQVSTDCWKIQNRSTNETKTVYLPNIQSNSPDLHFDGCSSNLDLAAKTVLINQLNSKVLHVINLETGEVQEIKILGTDPDNIYDAQMYGKIITYREYSKKKPALHVIDTTSGKEILNIDLPPLKCYRLMKDQIALAAVDKKGEISWSIIDFHGKTIKQGNFETNVSLDKSFNWNVFVYKNFLIIIHGPFIHFMDISSGKHLTSLLFNCNGEISGYDEGKFILSTADGIQVVDFESPDPLPDQPIRAVVINPNDTISTRTGTVNELVTGLIYSEDWKPSKAVSSNTPEKLDLSLFCESRSSRVVTLSPTERVTLVHFPWKFGGVIIKRITGGKSRPHQYDSQVRPLSHVKNFYGQGLLYKEELVDGKWAPVDLSVQQAEELINEL